MADLILLFDGTWNRADSLYPTNVVHTWHAVRREYSTWYDPGVGTNRWDRVRGGVAGVGLRKNVEDAYGWLADAWTPNDRIWILGYSRGAYTARSLAGLIGLCGIPFPLRYTPGGRIKHVRRAARMAMAAYRAGHRLPAQIPARRASIRFVGVWDTVGALGIPEPLHWLSRDHRFHDVALGTHIEVACHAVAIDEQRPPFSPALWVGRPHSFQQLHQVWFPGVHGDVGGGRSSRGLSDGSLLWMWECARAAGLRLDPVHAPRPDPFAPIHVSRTGVYRLWRPAPRPVPHPDAVQSLHFSAVQRLAADPDWQPRIAALLDAGAIRVWTPTPGA